MTGIYWRCPDCSATVVTTMPNPWLDNLCKMLNLPIDDALDFTFLPVTELERAERVVEEHEADHLALRTHELEAVL